MGKKRGSKQKSRRSQVSYSSSAASSAVSLINDPDPTFIEQAKEQIVLPDWLCPSNDEIHCLATMKAMLHDPLKDLQLRTIQLSDGDDVPLPTAFPDVYGDLRLLRFLRKDETQSPVRAATRYRDFIIWRKEYRVDELRALAQSSSSSPPEETMQMVADYMPCDFQAGPVDAKDGTMPIFLPIGKWKTREVMKQIRNGNLKLDTFLRYWAFMFDSLHKRLYEESLKSKRLLYVDQIFDTDGLSLSQLSPAFVGTVLKPWISLTQANYPETARRIIILNPPQIVSMVWRIVTPLANPSTVAKIKLVTNFPGTAREYLKQQLWRK